VDISGDMNRAHRCLDSRFPSVPYMERMVR
jgi:hypothetical protein